MRPKDLYPEAAAAAKRRAAKARNPDKLFSEDSNSAADEDEDEDWKNDGKGNFVPVLTLGDPHNGALCERDPDDDDEPLQSGGICSLKHKKLAAVKPSPKRRMRSKSCPDGVAVRKSGSRKFRNAVQTATSLEESASLLDRQMASAQLSELMMLLEGNEQMVARTLQWCKVSMSAKQQTSCPQIPGCYTRWGYLSLQFYKDRLRELSEDKNGVLSQIVDEVGRESCHDLQRLWCFATGMQKNEKIGERDLSAVRHLSMVRYLALGERLVGVHFDEKDDHFDWSGKDGALGVYRLLKVDESGDETTEVAGKECFNVLRHISGEMVDIPEEYRPHFGAGTIIESNWCPDEANIKAMGGRLTLKMREFFDDVGKTAVVDQKLAHFTLKQQSRRAKLMLIEFDETEMLPSIMALAKKGGNRSRKSRIECGVSRFKTLQLRNCSKSPPKGALTSGTPKKMRAISAADAMEEIQAVLQGQDQKSKKCSKHKVENEDKFVKKNNVENEDIVKNNDENQDNVENEDIVKHNLEKEDTVADTPLKKDSELEIHKESPAKLAQDRAEARCSETKQNTNGCILEEKIQKGRRIIDDFFNKVSTEFEEQPEMIAGMPPPPPQSPQKKRPRTLKKAAKAAAVPLCC